MKVVIIGAGVSGLTASYELKKAGIEPVILEKEDRPGGLSKSFQMGGEWFDIGGHATFAKDEYVRNLLESGVNYNKLKAVAYNYKKGKWIKNPVQINLASLDTEEKVSILSDYFDRPKEIEPQNYMDWLVKMYGRYFAENYPKLYTEKYWTVEPEQMETKWVGVRMYQPTVDEVLYGAFENKTQEVHYSGEIRYPLAGGFEMFINGIEKAADVLVNADIKRIDINNKLLFYNNECIRYNYIVNTAPLPEILKLIANVPSNVALAGEKLNATSLILVSILVRGKLKTDLSPAFYIYDLDIPATRVYSTTKYSGEYKGYTALQAEVYISKYRHIEGTYQEIADKVIKQLSDIGMYDMESVIEMDVRYEPYANIIFTHDIYENREMVKEYLRNNSVLCAGRFGEWDYLWTDQAILSGRRAAEDVLGRRKEG